MTLMYLWLNNKGWGLIKRAAASCSQNTAKILGSLIFSHLAEDQELN